MLQGICEFPGIDSVVEATISFVHGISPSVATLTIKPQVGFVGIGGTLKFLFSDTVIEFPDCKVDYNSLQRNRRGEIWRLSIFDRRWKWRWGNISGMANVRENSGTIKRDFERTPHQLAEICLAEIEETGYSLAGLPNDSRPETKWNDEVPMEALARLCDELGCRIVLGLDNRVRICKVGEGATLPLDGVLEDSLTIDPPEKPKAIGVICGPTRFQPDLELEAVGQDTDGSIKAIDDLSYKPALGWGDEVWWFNNVSGAVQQTLAAKTVYRWYRVKVPQAVPFFGNMTHLDQLELENVQLDYELVQIALNIWAEQPFEPWVYGVWFEQRSAKNTNTATAISPPTSLDDAQIYQRAEGEYRDRRMALDANRKLVMFEEPVFQNTNAGAMHIYAAATLRLRVACSVRKRTLNVKEMQHPFDQHKPWRALGGANVRTPETRWSHHPEITLNIVPKYNANFGFGRNWWNRADVDKETDHYMDGMEREYQQNLPQTIVYAGLRKVELDGAIQQIILSVGGRGATTMIARNTEVLHRTIPYKERRRIENTRNWTTKMLAWEKELNAIRESWSF